MLVVEESEEFLAGVGHWIRARRDVHWVGPARSSFAALDAVGKLCPDLVIVEAAPTGIDGFRLARALEERTSAPLVVIVTRDANAAAREEALAMGADGLLAKDELRVGLAALSDERKLDLPARADGVTTPAARARRGSLALRSP